MITIDAQKCIGCGLCVDDCMTADIEMKEGVATPRDLFCVECGHCLAICPTEAVDLPNYSRENIVAIDHTKTLVDPMQYLQWMKTRRTIRYFKDTPISMEHLQLILETGRFSPTGGNLQDVTFIVVQDSIEEVRKLAIESLYAQSDLSEEMKKVPNMERYAKKYVQMYEELQAGESADRLFFHAPLVIALSSPSPANAIIAAAHMETMIYALGLGMVYSGFTSRAINGSSDLKAYLGLAEKDIVHAVIVLGHPAVKYERSVERKAAKVIRR